MEGSFRNGTALSLRLEIILAQKWKLDPNNQNNY
ncbi:hypothetical protein HNP69_002394 [Chryseobacterium koreense]|nr:hypothetical protein [Chryseobacterium koreense]